MEHPLDEDLKVSLDTDASICDNWMEGKWKKNLININYI